MTAVMLGNSWVCTVVSMALIIWIMGVLYSCYSDDMGEFMKLKSLLPSLLKRLQINYFVLSVMLLLLQLDSLALFPWWQASPAVILWDFPAIGIPEQSWFNILAVISKLCEPSIHHAIVGSSVHISFSTIYVKGHLYHVYCHIFVKIIGYGAASGTAWIVGQCNMARRALLDLEFLQMTRFWSMRSLVSGRYIIKMTVCVFQMPGKKDGESYESLLYRNGITVCA